MQVAQANPINIGEVACWTGLHLSDCLTVNAIDVSKCFIFTDYIAALSSQSNYAESPYAAYSSRKRQQLAAQQSRQRKKEDRLSNPIAERPEREVSKCAYVS